MLIIDVEISNSLEGPETLILTSDLLPIQLHNIKLLKHSDMPSYILHDEPLSPNCYKIKLTASLLGQELDLKQYSVLKGETRTAEFLEKVSSYGKVPVLQIQSNEETPDTFLPESNAACWYLAQMIAGSTLIPSDPMLQAQVLRWMFFEQNQLETTIAALRFWSLFIGRDKLDAEKVVQIDGRRKRAEGVLDCMDQHLAKSESGWFVGEEITLADVVLYAYTHRAHEAEFHLESWPNVFRWCRKVGAADGYVAMFA